MRVASGVLLVMLFLVLALETGCAGLGIKGTAGGYGAAALFPGYPGLGACAGRRLTRSGRGSECSMIAPPPIAGSCWNLAGAMRYACPGPWGASGWVWVTRRPPPRPSRWMNAGVMVRIAASLPLSAIAEIGFRCDSARHGGDRASVVHLAIHTCIRLPKARLTTRSRVPAS